MDKIKVVLICSVTNPRIQEHLKLKIGIIERIARMLKGRSCDVSKLAGECNVFIENAIHEYEKHCNEIELHVISPHGWLKQRIQEFEDNGVLYHFFQNESQFLKNRILLKVFPSTQFSKYKYNRRQILRFVKRISPDIVYMSGAENPFYSMSALDIPRSIPFMVQLQTLMIDPNFEKNYPISHDSYIYRSSIEQKVLKRATYIGSINQKHNDIIKKLIDANSCILNTRLAIGEEIHNSDVKKDYDFVYFSANINKAFDLALEGFAIAQQEEKDITLLVVGDYDVEYKRKMDLRIEELGIRSNIIFTGRLPSHKDVLNEICSARFALLPLKIDIVSGTVREAMACGLPVVTTITEGGTPFLNADRETVLLSEIGNHEALANNMIRLLKNSVLAKTLAENGQILVKERYSNEAIVCHQIECLQAVINNFKYGTSIPNVFLA